MGPMQFILLVLIISNKIFCVGDEVDHGHAGTVDPYNEILHFYNLNSEENFTAEVLEEIFRDFAEKIECTEERNGTDDEDCSHNFCLNTSSVLAIVGAEQVPYITENTFDEISLLLLEIAIAYKEPCHVKLAFTEDRISSYRNNILSRITAGNVTTGIQLMPVQETLELMSLDKETLFNNTEAETHSHNEAEEQSQNEAEKDHSDSELFLKMCFGADIIFDQLGFDLDGQVPIDQAGKVATLAVYYILNGAQVSRDCRILPRQVFFFQELDHMYGNGNLTLGIEGLSEVMESLQIGNVHEELHAGEEAVDSHDHRRKRSADDDAMFQKASWEKTCYTDKQILAIFHAEESDIPAERFSLICPALIQQKLAGVCKQNNSDVKDHGIQPSTEEKYGYGSLATIIVCLCSVVGAFVVKVASSKAYDVIMALFLGLAVGTLFTDSMVHLLPTALGLHGHSEEEHDHGGDGIIVEDFVWYSLVACAALYVFFLYEKTMVLVRGQHGHSHGLSDISVEFTRENELQLSKGDKYSPDQMSERQEKDSNEKSKRGVSNVAVMVLVGDAVHNFADGLAIGASFSTSLALGLSTSLAVFCHELPHELGDFAVLLSGGISFYRALFLNVLVSITAMIGLYVGLVISDNESTKQWIVAVAAGLFIYISLVDLMPMLLKRTKNGVRDFLLHNLGMLLGAGAMVALAIFEEKIEINL